MKLIKVMRLSKTAQIPMKAHDTDSGFDLFADEDCQILPGSRKRIRTGVAVQLQIGVEGQVRSRSGLAEKFGIVVFNSPGTIDSGYRGEIEVLLANFGSEAFEVKPRMKIAQFVIVPICSSELVEASNLDITRRSTKGFGSSGKY